MGEVTVFTADRMLVIENEAIVSAVVDPTTGHLVLTRKDGGTSDAGNVKGPKGDAGVTSIVVCTRSTRPGSGTRFTGLFIYESDTHQVFVWNGASWEPKSGLFLCTSTTRPSGGDLFNGLEIYETDTARRLIYNGVRFDPDWKMPWGIQDRAFHADSATTYSAAPSSIQNGGSGTWKVTFAALTNRLYRCGVKFPFTNTTYREGAWVKLNCTNYGSTNIMTESNFATDEIGRGNVNLEIITNITAGNHDVTVQFGRTWASATGTLNLDTSTPQNVGTLYVEDVGPVPGTLPA